MSSKKPYNHMEMDFRLGESEERLRREVCDFLAAELNPSHDAPPLPQRPGYMPAREFELKLGAKGWLALSWPPEYGGAGRPVSEQFIVDEEVALHGGPASDALTRVIVAPILLAAGHDSQKRRYLPRLARGEITFCLGYTEPEAGSDLASLKTRAVRDGDDYVITGGKMFTSGAGESEYCWLAARTDPDARRNDGISVFIVPMDAPGVQVRSLVNLMDETWFNEIVFESVRVPATERIGPENQGWNVLSSALGLERITVYRAHIHRRMLTTLVRHAVETRDPLAREAVARLRTEYEIAGLLLWRAVKMHERAEEYRAQAAMVKLFNTEFAQRLYATAMHLLGPYGALMPSSHRAPWSGSAAHGYLSAAQDTIGAGTSEVQREIIALRGLGLPRG